MKVKQYKLFNDGFTLIELAVVILIIAILASFIQFSVSVSTGNSLRSYALAIKGAVEEMCDEALFSQKVTAMVLTNNTIRFTYMGDDDNATSWQELPNFRSHKLLNKLDFQSINFVHEDLSGFLHENQEVVWRCWPSGQMNPGQITFFSVDEEDKWFAKWTGEGEIKVDSSL